MRPKVDEEIRDEFARRLEDAFARSDATPRKKHGRYVWIREKMRERGINLTGETVRRWFTGGVMPQPDAMVALASIIGVDPGWLAHGTTGVAQTVTGPEAEEMAAMTVERHRNALATSYMVGRLGMMGLEVGPEGTSAIEVAFSRYNKVLCNVVFGLVGADNRVTIRFPDPERASGKFRPLFIVVGRAGKEPDVFFLMPSEVRLVGANLYRFRSEPGSIELPFKNDKGEPDPVILDAERDLSIITKLF